MVEDTEAYYRRRSREELLAADNATDENAANVHRALAARYSLLSGEPPLRGLDGPQRDQADTPQRLSKAG